jgi:transcriptional regulator with XRE-family HTH domain
MPDYPQAAAGKVIRARRVALKFSSMEALADKAGSSPRMVADAELGVPVGTKTRIRISRALEWTDDSIDRLYRGEDPIEREPELIQPTQADEPAPENLGVLTARMAQIRRRLERIPEVWDEHGPEAARAAVANLSAQMATLQQQIADAENADTADANGENPPRHAS